MPKLPGHDRFGAPLFHSRDFAAQSQALKGIKDAVVLSGAKSAWDVAYSLASVGVQVHWVIRKSGESAAELARQALFECRLHVGGRLWALLHGSQPGHGSEDLG